MSNLRKTMSLLVALLFIASFLVACGKTDEVADPGPADDPVVSDPIDEEDVSAKIDLNGRTIRVASWWDLTPEGGTELKDLYVKRVEDVEQRFNVKFEWLTIPSGEIKSKFAAAAMGGGSIADLVIMRHDWAIPDLAKEGYLLALDGLIDFNADYYSAAGKYSEFDGKRYGLVDYDPSSASLLYFNKRIFEQNGMPNMYELVKNKEWTWEKFEELARALTKDTNGDGINDIWGYGLQSDSDPANWIFTNGGEYGKLDGATPVSTLTDGKVVETIQWLNKLINTDKVVNYPAESVEWDYSMKMFMEGKLAMTTGGWWMAGDMKDVMDDQFGVLPLPMGPNTTDYVFTGTEVQFYVAPANLENAKEVLMAFDAIKQPLVPKEEADEAEMAGKANEVWDAESLETYLMMKSKFAYAQHFALGDYWGTIHPGVHAALKGEKSATAAMEEVSPAWLSSMQEKMGQ